MPKRCERMVDVEPHSLTKNLRNEYMAPIISTKHWGRPKRNNAVYKLEGEIESKAFALSSGGNSLHPPLAAHVSSKSRLTMKIASAVLAPDLHLNWVGSINVSALSFNRLSSQ